MPDSSSKSVPPGVKEGIEELALRMVLGGGWDAEQATHLDEALERVEAAATGEDWGSLARRAQELRAMVADAQCDEESDPREIELRVHAGVVNLQRMLTLQGSSHRGAPPLKADSTAAGDALPEDGSAGAPAPNPGPNPLATDPESIADFVLESSEHFQALDEEILRIERQPDDIELLNGLFRRFHTLKGLAGFLDLTEIKETAHAVEALLDRARSGSLVLTPEAIDLLLESNDALREDVATVRESSAKNPGVPATIASRSALRKKLEDFQPAVPDEGRDEKTETPADSAEPAQPRGGPVAVTTRIEALRVDTRKLDALVEMIGELVIAQSIALHHPAVRRTSDSELSARFAQLGRLTQQVQRSAMRLRMVPLALLFDRAARLVRDLSRKAGKPVRVEREGQETEVDKSIVELLADPLLHMVRNALDHGVETPEDRRAAGKPAEALIKFRAKHHSGNIVVEIADDGAGVDEEKVLARARERGLIAPDHTPSKSDTLELLFAPGFSTADRVTEISGRGVGMDVVGRNLKQLRGRVSIHSERGLGATVRLTIPLTLAVIDGLVVGVGDERYVAPMFAVREMIRPGPGTIQRVEGKDDLALIRGELLPVASLADIFGIPSARAGLSKQVLLVTILEGRKLCLAVDEFLGKQEIVIKNLDEPFDRLPGISGGAILGDGRPALILDVATLATGVEVA